MRRHILKLQAMMRMTTSQLSLVLFVFGFTGCPREQTPSDTMTKAQSAQSILEQLPVEASFQGDHLSGEIELANPDGFPELLYEDKYVALIRDDVIFPGGKKGKYLRVVEKGSFGDGIAGVVIIPKYESKFVFVRNFRHPTRTWELEFPRGFCEAGQAPELNAKREVEEELDAQVSDLKLLGKVKPNSGLLSSSVCVFSGTVDRVPDSILDQAREEAIIQYEVLTKQEVAAAIADGKIEDGFTLSAWALLNAQDQASH